MRHNSGPEILYFWRGPAFLSGVMVVELNIGFLGIGICEIRRVFGQGKPPGS